MYKFDEVRKIIKEKVEGKWVAEHSVFGHFYRNAETNNVMSSVTSVNVLEKPHLIPWAIGLVIEFFEQGDNFNKLKGPTREEVIKTAKLLHRDIRDEAGTIGGKAHDIIEQWENEWIDTGIKPGDIREWIKAKGINDYRVWGAARSAEAAFEKYNVIPVATELLVGLEGVGAGTLDLIVLNQRGELELWDHKTSNSISDFYAIQVSAYKKFFEKMTGLKIKRCKILKLDKYSNRYKVYNLPDMPQAYKIFKALYTTHQWLYNGKDKYSEDKIVMDKIEL